MFFLVVSTLLDVTHFAHAYFATYDSFAPIILTSAGFFIVVSIRTVNKIGTVKLRENIANSELCIKLCKLNKTLLTKIYSDSIVKSERKFSPFSLISLQKFC